jgi:hypothetical protein
MAPATRKPDPALPPEVADALENAGYSAEIESLLRIISDFAQQQRIKSFEQSETKAPLKTLLPDDVKYERARRAAEAGRLEAEKVGKTRWRCTPRAMTAWLRAIGWLHQ